MDMEFHNVVAQCYIHIETCPPAYHALGWIVPPDLNHINTVSSGGCHLPKRAFQSLNILAISPWAHGVNAKKSLLPSVFLRLGHAAHLHWRLNLYIYNIILYYIYTYIYTLYIYIHYIYIYICWTLISVGPPNNSGILFNVHNWMGPGLGTSGWST